MWATCLSCCVGRGYKISMSNDVRRGNYFPLITIIIAIVLASVAISAQTILTNLDTIKVCEKTSSHDWSQSGFRFTLGMVCSDRKELIFFALKTIYFDVMQSFMGLFFLVFAIFKLVDLHGFVKGFAMYDLPTRAVRGYGYIYPFMELALGLAYLAGVKLASLYIITLIVMSLSAIGVIYSVQKGMNLRCACLGTSLNVPLSTVSIIENVGMALMAAAMLLLLH